MQILDLIPGSPEWHQHRNSGKYFNASDAPAMMGVSPYETRNQLLHRLATGITPEVDAATQRRFDEGHRFEALASPLAVKIVGEELYAVVGVEDNLSGSFDGLTMGDDTAWEHKRINDVLREAMPQYVEGGAWNSVILPPIYAIQCEHQLAVCGAEKTLFSATNWDKDGNLTEQRHCWYEPDQELRAQIVAGWAQFAIDLANYVPPVVVDAPVKKITATLPVVLDMRVEGKLVSCNIEQYKPAALAYIAAINTDLDTDQDFADADADGKYCRESAKKLELSIELALGQMGDINTVIATVREIEAAFDAKGLVLEKLVKSEKESRRADIIKKARSALYAHESGLQERTQHHLKPTLNNFEGVVKNLRTIASLQNAVDTELARCKIEANAAADRITANLAILGERKDMAALFPDVGMLVHKAADDLRNTVTARIATHEAAEAAKLEAQREKIRAEEIAKLAAEKEAKAFDAQSELDQQASIPAVVRSVVDAPIPVAARPSVGLPSMFSEILPVPLADIFVDTGARMNLGQIKEQIAPFSISAEGLATLGILHVDTQGAAKYYRVSDCQRIFSAIKGLKK